MDLSIEFDRGPVRDPILCKRIKVLDLEQKKAWSYLVHREDVSAKLCVHPSEASSAHVRLKLLDHSGVVISALPQH